MSNLCVECEKKPKAPNAYLYCKDCRIKVSKVNKRNSSRKLQAKRRMKNYSKCEECKERFTYTKYCKSCSQTAHRNKCRERSREKRRKIKEPCERCGTKKKWSTNSTTKYCYECKVIVQKEKIQEKNRARDKIKKNSKQPRKKPVHKGVALDPTSQKPKIKAPKMQNKDGGINPYFLRRGDPSGNGPSAGFTQCNQE